MTYTEAISRLNEKLRDSEAWPSDTSKLSEQLFLLYNAALAVLKGIPLDRLTKVESSPLAPVAIVQEPLFGYNPPATTFYFRDDWGIGNLMLDGKIFLITQTLPIETVISINYNMKHKFRTLVAIDKITRRIFASNVTELKIEHFPKPALPATGAPEYPLSDDNDFELAMTIVAAHVTGETIRDGAQSQFQSFLSLIYGDDNVRE